MMLIWVLFREKFLAKIYCKYGSKLLQGNIRAFLSVRGKVNKGIRETIIKHPGKFLYI